MDQKLVTVLGVMFKVYGPVGLLLLWVCEVVAGAVCSSGGDAVASQATVVLTAV